MYFSDEIILITTDDSGTDEIGRQTETEMGRVTVYGDIKSVSREESFTAGSHGVQQCTEIRAAPVGLQRREIRHGGRQKKADLPHLSG